MSGPVKLGSLYRAILKLHKDKLPAPMRTMGDKYVKTEFLAHMKPETTEQQWSQFASEWQRYYVMMSGQGDSEQQPPDVLDLMNPEQQSKMSTLYQEAKRLRRSMIDDALPDVPGKGR